MRRQPKCRDADAAARANGPAELNFPVCIMPNELQVTVGHLLTHFSRFLPSGIFFCQCVFIPTVPEVFERKCAMTGLCD